MNVYFIGDLHFGHNNIHRFRPELNLSSEEEHREFLIDKWNSKVKSKRDVVWVLGDSCFKMEAMHSLDRLRGIKFLIAGNHDIGTEHLRHHFQKVCGFQKYKEFWLSHCPIHPDELRRKINIHGHVHNQTLKDTKNYFNASCENINYEPVSIEEIRERVHEG